MKALFGIGFMALVVAVAGLEGGAFNCLQALLIGGIGAAVAMYGFNHSDLRA